MVNTKSIIFTSALASFLIAGLVYASSSTFFISNDTLFLDDKLTAIGSLKVNNGKLEVDYVASATHLKIHDNASTLTAKKFFDIVADTSNKLRFKDFDGSELLEIDGTTKGFTVKKSLKILNNLFSLGFEDLTDPTSKSFVFGSAPTNTFLFNNLGGLGWSYKFGTIDLMNISNSGAITLGNGVVLNTNGNGITNLLWGQFTGNPVGGLYVKSDRTICDYDGNSTPHPDCGLADTWMSQWNDDKNATLEVIRSGFGIIRDGLNFSVDFDMLLTPIGDAFGKSFELTSAYPALANHKIGLRRYDNAGVYQGWDIDDLFQANPSIIRTTTPTTPSDANDNFVQCNLSDTFVCSANSAGELDDDGILEFGCCSINLNNP